MPCTLGNIPRDETYVIITVYNSFVRRIFSRNKSAGISFRERTLYGSTFICENAGEVFGVKFHHFREASIVFVYDENRGVQISWKSRAVTFPARLIFVSTDITEKFLFVRLQIYAVVSKKESCFYEVAIR